MKMRPAPRRAAWQRQTNALYQPGQHERGEVPAEGTERVGTMPLPPQWTAHAVGRAQRRGEKRGPSRRPRRRRRTSLRSDDVAGPCSGGPRIGPGPAPVSTLGRRPQSASIKTSIQIRNLPPDEGPPIVGVVGLLRLARWRGLLGEPEPTTAGDRARGADASSALGAVPGPRYRAQASEMGAVPDGSPAPVGGDARRAGAKKPRCRGERP